MMAAISILWLLFWFHYLSFASSLGFHPPLLPHPSHPIKCCFFTDLQESTSVSLPLLAQPQTAAISLFKVTLKIGNVEKISPMGRSQVAFWKWKEAWAETWSTELGLCSVAKEETAKKPMLIEAQGRLSGQGSGELGANQELISPKKCMILSPVIGNC